MKTYRQHVKAREPQRKTPQAQRRVSASKRGYGRLWERLRAMVLAKEPLCRKCAQDGVTRAATDVDHIVPQSRGGTDEPNNLQPLCHWHHSRKTATEDGGFGHGC